MTENVVKEVEKEFKKETKKKNPYVFVTVILGILLVASMLTQGFSIFSSVPASTASEKVKGLILTATGEEPIIDSISESNGLYKINTTIQGKPYSFYVTKDGKLFIPQVIPFEQQPSGQQNNQTTTFNAPDSNKPTVQLFVMSFCPYGIQAEKALFSVVKLMGEKAKFEPHFIVSVSGDKVSSLHGDAEAKEDMRQAVIYKYYPDKFWSYAEYVANNCNLNTIESCWKDAIKSVGIDSADIEKKVTSEGLELMKAEAELSNSKGISGSPTMLINGATYTGARSSDAFKQGICTGFSSAPTECSSNLTSNVTQASGSC